MNKKDIIDLPKTRASKNSLLISGKEFCTSEERNRVLEIYKKISVCAEKIVEQTKTALELHFEAGQMLKEKMMQFRASECTTAQIAKAFGVSENAIRTSIKIYAFLTNHPEAKNTLSTAEVLRLLANKKEASKTQAAHIEYAGDYEEAQDFTVDDMFAKNTASGVSLSEYRFYASGTEVWMFKKGFPHGIRFLQVMAETPKDATLKVAYDEFLKGVQKESEKYFAAVEIAEKREEQE